LASIRPLARFGDDQRTPDEIGKSRLGPLAVLALTPRIAGHYAYGPFLAHSRA
jgi:hypothetical protein